MPTNAPAVVQVTNHLEEPVTVFAPESDNCAFAALLRTNKAGRSFELLITPVLPLSAGITQGQIRVKTSATEVPTLTITAVANVQPAITVMPSQIVLPPAPLPTKVITNLSIQYYGTNTLALSNPFINNAKGVKIRVREVRPGHVFAVLLTFPKSFETVASQPVEFTIKSNHPQCPVLRTRILQTPRPAGNPL